VAFLLKLAEKQGLGVDSSFVQDELIKMGIDKQRTDFFAEDVQARKKLKIGEDAMQCMELMDNQETVKEKSGKSNSACEITSNGNSKQEQPSSDLDQEEIFVNHDATNEFDEFANAEMEKPIKLGIDYDYMKEFAVRPTTEERVHIDLLKKLNKWNAPDYAFQDILEWAEWAAMERHDFRRPHLKSRDANIKHYAKMMQMQDLYPQEKFVSLDSDLPNSDKFPVTCFSFERMLRDLLADPELMQHENMLVDPEDFRKMYDWNNNNPVLNEIVHGKWMKRTTKKYKKDVKDWILPIMFYKDKAVIDMFGRWGIDIILFTIALFNYATRQRNDAWRPLGIHTMEKQTAAQKADATKENKTIYNFHEIMKKIMEEVKSINESGVFKNVTVRIGNQVQECNIIIVIAGFSADGKEGDYLCMRKFAYSGDDNHISRACDCPLKDACNMKRNCKYRDPEVLKKDLAELTSKEYYEKHDLKPFYNPMWDLNFGDNPHNIYFGTPVDLLHMMDLGLVKKWTESVLQFGIKTKRKKLIVDDTVRQFNSVRRQSIFREYPRCTFPNGLCHLTQATAREYVGMLFTLLCILYQDNGSGPLSQDVWNKEGEFGSLINCMEMMLCGVYCFNQESFWKREDVSRKKDFEKAVKTMIETIINYSVKYLGMQPTDWLGQKLHDLLHMADNIEEFGSLKAFHCMFGERSHQYFVKPNGERAHKEWRTFFLNVASRIVDRLIVDSMYKRFQWWDIKVAREDVRQGQGPQENVFKATVINQGVSKVAEPEDAGELSGTGSGEYNTCGDDSFQVVESFARSTRYEIGFLPPSKKTNPSKKERRKNKGKGKLPDLDNFYVKWNTKSQGEMGIPQDVRDFLLSSTDIRKPVTCYTEYQRNDEKFRCHPNYRLKGPWYDWAFFQIQEDDGEIVEYPGRIYAFIMHKEEPHAIVHLADGKGGGKEFSSITNKWYLPFVRNKQGVKQSRMRLLSCGTISRTGFLFRCKPDNYEDDEGNPELDQTETDPNVELEPVIEIIHPSEWAAAFF